MAYGTLIMTHAPTGGRKKVPVGFSWTTLFWGFWPALLRLDWKYFLIQFIVGVVLAATTMGIGNILFSIIFGFYYNRLYCADLVADGWRVSEYFGMSSLVQASGDMGMDLERLRTAAG